MTIPKRKILSLLLVAVMLFTMMPPVGFATGGEPPLGDSATPSDIFTADIVIAGFDALDDDTLYQGYDAGTVTLDGLNLPDALTGTDEDDNAITLDGVTWQSEPDFDPEASAWYEFSTVLPQGYTLADGATAPVISVFIRPEGGVQIQPLSGGVTGHAYITLENGNSVGYTLKTGSQLKANTAFLNPSTATLAYQWYSGGNEISGANSQTYTLTATETSGSQITVKITASGDGSGTLTSGAVEVGKTMLVEMSAFSLSAPSTIFVGEKIDINGDFETDCGDYGSTDLVVLLDGTENRRVPMMDIVINDEFEITTADLGKTITGKIVPNSTNADTYTGEIYVTNAIAVPADAFSAVTTAEQLIAALQSATARAINVTADIALKGAGSALIVTLGADHTLNIASGKTLTIGDGINDNRALININGHTLTINGGGKVLIDNYGSNGIYAIAGTLNLTDIEVEVTNSVFYGLGNIQNLNINSGATVNLNASTGYDLIRINSGQTLTINSGGTVNVNAFTGTGINNWEGTVHINGGTLLVKAGGGNNYGISNNSDGLLKYTSGALNGETNTCIYLVNATKVEGMGGRFNDRGTDFTAMGQVTVGAADAAVSAAGLSEGLYVWNGSIFRKEMIIISAQPQDITVTQGAITESLNVAATASNGETVSYQWRLYNEDMYDYEPISGATNSTYALPTDLQAGTYYYDCELTATGCEKLYTSYATVTVNPPGGATPTVTSVTVSPSAIEVQKGTTQQFAAAVTGTNSPATTVTWEVSGGIAGTSINANGLLTVAAGETAAALTVTATATADTSKSGTAIVTVTTDAPTPSYGIALDISGTHTFPAATAGYGAQTAKSATITNIGNTATGALTIALSGANASSFTLSKTNIADIANDGNDTFTVAPNIGLAAGTYTATITVSGANVTAQSFSVSFTVNSAAPATYTIIFNANGGSVAITSMQTGADGKLATLPTPIRSGYTFNGWFDAVSGGAQITTSYVFSANTTIYARWSAIDGGQVNPPNPNPNPNPSPSPNPTPTPNPSPTPNPTSNPDPTPTPNPDPSPNDDEPPAPEAPASVPPMDQAETPVNAETPIQGKPDEEGKLTFTPEAENIAEALEEKPETLTFTTEETGLSAVDIQFSEETIQALADAGVKEIIVQAGDFQVSISLEEISAAGGAVTVTAEKYTEPLSDDAEALVGNRPVWQISVSGSSAKMRKALKNGAVRVGMRYTPAKGEIKGNLCVARVDGEAAVLLTSSYSNGWMLWKGEIGGAYGIAYTKPEKSYSDHEGHWAKQAIDFAISRNLVAGYPSGKFNADKNMLRGDAAAALSKLTGEKISLNNPDKTLKRGDLAELLANALEMPKLRNAFPFADTTSKSARAVQQAGLMSALAANNFGGSKAVKRGEFCAILQRIAGMDSNPDSLLGWATNDSGKKIYYDAKGNLLTGWQKIDGKSYYFNENGEMQTGWKNIGDGRYYFNNNGTLVTGCWKKIDGKWYYFQKNGQLATNTTIDGYPVDGEGVRK